MRTAETKGRDTMRVIADTMLQVLKVRGGVNEGVKNINEKPVLPNIAGPACLSS